MVHRELMADHYVKLLFSLAEPIYLHIGDYIDLPDFGRFELTVPYAPKYNSETAGYDYTLQLDAYYIKWKNKKVRYIPAASASETTFNLTATIAVHLNVIVNGINAIGNKDASFKYEGTTAFRYELRNYPADKAATARLKQYNNTDFISALNDLATIFEGEWWVEDNTIFFGKCRIEGEEIDFELDSNVEEMSGSQSKNEYATRIIAFGAARNLPPDYRKDSSADVTVNGIVQKRLMLPLVKCPNGYVQDDSVLNEAEAIEAILVDESIYPRTKCIVDRVETYTDTTEDENTGETITQTFYRLYDGSGFVFSSDYILEGETLHIQFQSGHMNGMDFECQYNDEHGYYEVVVNEEYGRPLPDVDLHPEVNDEFVLYGWDSTKIGSTGLIDAAEEELYQATVAKLQDMKIDPNTYNCTLRSDWYEDKMERESLSTYSMGQPVRLINPTYFANGRSSRIIGYEVKLDFIYDKPMYIVGEATAYSRSQKMEDQLDSITYNGASYKGSGSGGGGVYLITSTSSTPSSDSNVYSAKRSDKQFLRRDKDDTAYGVITFDKDTKFRNGLGSNDFAQGEFGAGYHMGKYGNTNDSYLEIDRLFVRKMAYYVSLAIKRLDHVGGSVGVSPADLTISNVEVLDDVYRCYVDLTDGHSTINIEDWQVGDLARCQTFNVNQATYYWRAVDNVDYQNGYVDLSIEDCDTGSGIPKRGDVLVVVGNKTDATRQNFIEISSTGSSSPSIKIYHGINDYSLVDKDATSFEYDPTTGRMKMVVYGDMYVGDRLQTNYIKYDQDGGLNIRANNFTYKRVDKQGQVSYKTIDEVIEDINSQNDGYFLVHRMETATEPSSSALPESEWTTNEMKYEHVGDIYLNSEGLAWEYKYLEGHGYYWQPVSDSYLIAALSIARSKKRCWAGVYGTNTPTSGEYSKGDMWVKATYADGTISYDNEMLVCISDGDWSSFSIADWDLANNYQQRLDTMSEDFQEWREAIESQIDGTAESFVTTSSINPSLEWDASEYAEHKGDIWVQEDTGLSYYWNGEDWIPSQVDLYDLTDKVDGKATVFVNKPNSKRYNADGSLKDDGYLYRERDIWILENDDVYAGYEKGTIMVATASSKTTYNASHWVKKDCYMGTAEKNALREAGFDWDDNEYHAYADKFFFRSRSAQNPVNLAVFEEINGKGYIRTDLLRADEIVTNKVVARDADGHILSIYNGNGNGTIVYYYPDGSVMKEDLFTYTKDATTGEDKISGMITRYYNPDGSIAWFVNQSGDVEKNLHYYWRLLGYLGVATTPTNLRQLASLVMASWSTKVPTANRERLCEFYSDTYDPDMYAYNGLTCYGNHSGVDPTHTSVVGTEVTGYVSSTTTPEEVALIDEDESDILLKGYYFTHYNNGKSDSAEYFVAINGTVWDAETNRQIDV